MAIVIILHTTTVCDNNCLWYSIDATRSERIGRYVNHAKHQYNAKTIVVTVESRPHLCIIATRDIVNGEEILCLCRQKEKCS